MSLESVPLVSSCVVWNSLVEVMPAKKGKHTTASSITTSKPDSFVLLRDEKNSRHVVFPRDQLVCAKKDSLKVGTYATFEGNGDRKSKCRGIVVLGGKLPVKRQEKTSWLFLSLGTKEQCDTSLSVIERINTNFTRDSEDESDASPSLLIGRNDDAEVDNLIGDQEGSDGQTSPQSPRNRLKSQESSTVGKKNSSPTILSKTPVCGTAAPSRNVNSSIGEWISFFSRV